MDPKDLIEYEGGEILASLEERTISGLLLPYNEVGRTNAGRFMVEAGAVSIPTDPAIVGLNLDHDRSASVGRAVKLEEKPQGIFATFTIAKTPEGDAALADAVNPNGIRRKLSAEFHTAIKAGKAVAGKGRLWGASLVPEGAFPSAMVLAADSYYDELEEGSTSSSYESKYTDSEGSEYADSSSTTEEVEDLGDGRKRVTRTTVTVTEAKEPTEESDEEEEEEVPVAASKDSAAPAATAPRTMQHAPARTEPRELDMRSIYAAIATQKANPNDRESYEVLAALTDIKLTGTGSLPAGGGLQPNWVGQIDQGEEYQREYITLGKLGTDITAGGKKGFKVHRGTSGTPLTGPQDGTWAGNKAAISSYAGFTTSAESTLKRFAVGNDIGREFYDLPGGAEYVEAFLKFLVEDYNYWTDNEAAATWITAAGTPVAAATTKYPSNYPDALGMLIQGILAVKKKKADKRRDTPTFAIANELAFEELAYAAGGEQNLPEFVSIALSTNGTGTVDGNVQVVQGDTGIDDTASVIVGARKAVEFDELAGGTLHINAIELAKGGIDRAVHGYLQQFAVRPEAVVLIGTADSAG